MNAHTQGDLLGDQPSFPLLTAQELEPICRSPAMGAFMARRLEQLLKHGHSPAGDMANPVDHLLREARARIDHALEWLGHGNQYCPPVRLDQVLRKVELAGALLLAAHDRISATAPTEGIVE